MCLYVPLCWLKFDQKSRFPTLYILWAYIPALLYVAGTVTIKGGGAQHNYAHQHQIDLEATWPGKTAQKTVVRIAFCLLQKTLKGFDIFCCCCIFLYKKKVSWFFLFVFQCVLLLIHIQIAHLKTNVYFIDASFIIILVL